MPEIEVKKSDIKKIIKLQKKNYAKRLGTNFSATSFIKYYVDQGYKNREILTAANKYFPTLKVSSQSIASVKYSMKTER